MTHLQEANEKLKNIQGLFDVISRNIYTKNDIDKELTDQTIEAKKTQKWLSIIKMASSGDPNPSSKLPPGTKWLKKIEEDLRGA